MVARVENVIMLLGGTHVNAYKAATIYTYDNLRKEFNLSKTLLPINVTSAGITTDGHYIYIAGNTV